MGAFNDVKISPTLLPRKYRKYEWWQTKDVTEPEIGQSHTLVVAVNGLLFHEYSLFDYDATLDENSYVCLNASLREKGTEQLSFTGKMRFCTGNGRDVNSKRWKLVELVADFICGNLISIKED